MQKKKTKLKHIKRTNTNDNEFMQGEIKNW